ncbi:small acid-soluble spore protein P [Paenibacillus eucommiae]|uniref:Small acid-soluble spore protein P (Minor) n=1 Tax=Paenibacillus eucommiae TaxID=1355755 RepID=A0ABS4IY27_9BACL|nr:small acid-soluble spore protein P [Paenibacillus eucommiae]MBP1992498.1 small acid-soluble spore protein P (minor) [Paenibacillus eucommiae]
MSKPKTQPVGSGEPSREREDKGSINEPLSGSKKVKNAQHSRQNHGEGS